MIKAILLTELTAILLASTAGAGAGDLSKITEAAWQPLFNGIDLNDWDIHIKGQEYNMDPYNTFRVTDGMLEVSYDDYPDWKDRFGHLGYKKNKFSHYIVAAEYKFHKPQMKGGPSWAGQNNGIMFHSQATRDLGKGQDFPNSIEVQLLGPENNLKRTTASVCTPETHVYDIEVPGGLKKSGKHTQHCTPAKEVPETFDKDGWTRTEVLVLGDSLVKHIVKKDTVVIYKKPSLDNGQSLKEGYIAIQGESSPTLFRKIEIINLVGCTDPKMGNYQPWHIREKQPSDCKEKTSTRHVALADGEFRVTRTHMGIKFTSPRSYHGSVTIQNAVGQTLRTLETSGSELSLSATGWAAGLYFASIQVKNRNIKRKFVLID